MATPRELLDVQKTAEYLGTSERHVRELWSTHRIAGIKLGHLLRFDTADLDAYIQSRRVEASK